MLALEIVGHLEIPAEVLDHRFVREGLRLLARVESFEDEPQYRVIGTSHCNRKVQLYGWAPDITEHADDTGIIYAACLTAGTSTLLAQDDAGRPPLSVSIPAGAVFRLDDRVPHWTQDSASRLAVFVGPFEEPCDEDAVERLRQAVGQLAAGLYDAPRVTEGHVQLDDDECWATRDFENREIMLLADADARGYHVLDCECGKPATVIDHYWPYHMEGNLCASCK